MSQAGPTSDGWLSKTDWQRFDSVQVTSGLPLGGLDGQVLSKLSDLDFDVGWTDASLADAARLSLPNVFDRETTFSGIRFGDIMVVTAASYTALPTDCFILCDCTVQDVVINLPPATGTGQTYRIRRIDTSSNQARIRPAPGDMIDASSMIALSDVRNRVLITDILLHLWDLQIVPTVAYTDLPNNFAQPTTVNGLNLGSPNTINDNYTVLPTDSEILVDCSVLSKDINVFLPPANSTGQILHIKKIDSTPHNLIITAGPLDNIDGSTSIAIGDPLGDALLIAGGNNYWDNTGPTMDNVMFFPFYGALCAVGSDEGLYIYNPDQAKFHLLSVRGAAGAEYLTIGPGVTPP